MTSHSKYKAELVTIGRRHFESARVIQGKKHLALECTANGQVRRVFCSTSPSDRRVLLNIEAQVARERKMIK